MVLLLLRLGEGANRMSNFVLMQEVLVIRNSALLANCCIVLSTLVKAGYFLNALLHAALKK
jgi:hypothetical protein